MGECGGSGVGGLNGERSKGSKIHPRFNVPSSHFHAEGHQALDVKAILVCVMAEAGWKVKRRIAHVSGGEETQSDVRVVVVTSIRKTNTPQKPVENAHGVGSRGIKT